MMKKGSAGDAVRRLQAMIGAPVTGTFDPRTEGMVKAKQRQLKLTPDGIVGPKTWPKLAEEALKANKGARLWPKVEIVKVELQQSSLLDALVDDARSYAHLRLRAPTAKRLQAIFAELEGSGAVLTTSGGMRSLRAEVSKSRSATSFHYSGRALDLGIYTGVNPGKDPIIVARDPALASERRFRVYANATNLDHPLVEVRRVKALSLATKSFVSFATAMLDLTALFEKHGFKGIGARSWAWSDPFGGYKGLEWWHFQDEEGLVEGQSTFGDSLLEVHDFQRVGPTAPWEKAGEFFGEGWR